MNSYLLYIIGVLLLTFPSAILVRNRLNLASLHEIMDRPRYRLGWLHIMNATDLARAYAGMTLLLTAFATLHPYAPGHLITHAVIAITAVSGLLLQHIFHKSDRDELPAPLAYTLGLILAMLPPQVFLLALPLGVAAALAMQNIGFGLALATIGTAVLGTLFGVSLITTGTTSLLFFLPVAVSSLLHKQLVLSVRRGPLVRQESFRVMEIKESRETLG